MVINCSFTAGGLASPLFVVVYGLTKEEVLSEDDIITMKVPSLIIGSHQDVYSAGHGYLTFVRCKHEDDLEEDEEIQDNPQQQTTYESKEARIASKYRRLIYHPFIDHIRITRYNWDCIQHPDVPPHLTAVSWMDGANRQLKKITSETHLNFEKERRVICCKHSASCTAVGQAADTGPMFKMMRSVLKGMDSPNSSVSHVYHYIKSQLDDLQEKGILMLASHKKKAILSTVPKLPSATGRSHSVQNIRKAFILNSQLDVDSKLLPCFDNLLHTFRGNVNGTCLANKEWLLSKCYDEMYCSGHISEDSFDKYMIPKD